MNRALQKEQTRERVKRYRERQKQGDSVTSLASEGQALHPIVYWLIDPRRQKLIDVCKALERHNQFELYFGCGRDSLPFSEVRDLLEATT